MESFLKVINVEIEFVLQGLKVLYVRIKRCSFLQCLLWTLGYVQFISNKYSV